MIGRRSRAVLGVGISTDAVRAVVLRAGTVLWTRELPLDAERSLLAAEQEDFEVRASVSFRRAVLARALGEIATLGEIAMIEGEQP